MTRLLDCAKEDEVLVVVVDDEVHWAIKCLRVSSSEGDKGLMSEVGVASLGSGVLISEII